MKAHTDVRYIGERRAFGHLPIRPVSPKPRESGITIVMDWCMPLPMQEGLLEIAADAIDVAKIANGLAALLGEDLLDRKIDLYHRHGVKVHPGKRLLEYAASRGLEAEFFRECVQRRFDLVEIADDISGRTPDTKHRLMRAASDAGLPFVAVADGLGSAEASGRAKPNIHDIITDLRQCRAAGAWKVVIAAWELISSGELLRRELLVALESEVPIQDLVWALPALVTRGRLLGWDGSPLPATRDLEAFLVAHLGPDVNVTNLAWDWLVPFEGLRRGVGQNSRDPVDSATMSVQ